jgi:hypothetical protein
VLPKSGNPEAMNGSRNASQKGTKGQLTPTKSARSGSLFKLFYVRRLKILKAELALAVKVQSYRQRRPRVVGETKSHEESSSTLVT